MRADLQRLKRDRESERYDGELTDVFAIQDEICQAIVDKLRVELAPGRPLLKRYTENVTAYNLYLQGRHHFWKWTPDGTAKSREFHEQAIAVDPNYALAWYGLAYFYHALGFLGGMPPKAANARSCQALLKALELDDTLAEAHAMMGLLRAVDDDWKGAICFADVSRFGSCGPWRHQQSLRPS